MTTFKSKKRKHKKPRNLTVVEAIFRKAGPYKDKRDKRGKRDELWIKDLENNS